MRTNDIMLSLSKSVGYDDINTSFIFKIQKTRPIWRIRIQKIKKIWKTGKH
jgi:hypothetical protein